MRLSRKSKSRQTNSSFGYFDLGNKTVVPYNLKHLLRSFPVGGNMASFPEEANWVVKLPDPKPMVWNSPTTLARDRVVLLPNSSQVVLGLSKRISNRRNLVGDTAQQQPKVWSYPAKDLRSSMPPTGCGKPLFDTFTFELPWGNPVTAWQRHTQGVSGGTAAGSSRLGQGCPLREAFVPPHEVKKCLQNDETWNWLSWNMKRNNPISGRVGRSLQRAGICVLLGGFTAFLPYKEYSQRNALISTKEADLQSFQILSMKHANLNCVLSKDRVTYSYDREWNV